MRIAIKLKKGDFEGGCRGLKNLTRDDVPDMYDPALVELSLEICADAISAATAGNDSMQPSSVLQMQLVRQLYRIEVPNGARLPSRH